MSEFSSICVQYMLVFQWPSDDMTMVAVSQLDPNAISMLIIVRPSFSLSDVSVDCSLKAESISVA